ncbi:MAG: response regulator transcription factor [Nitrospiria bacterium]
MPNEVESSRPDTSVRPEARLLNPIPKVSGIGEEELCSLVRRRAQPGIIILNQEGEALYLNHDAESFLGRLMSKSHVPGPKNGTRSLERNPVKGGNDERFVLPEIIYELSDHFNKMIRLEEGLSGEDLPTVNRICIHEGAVYLLRALLLRQQDVCDQNQNKHIMVLIEKVSKGVRVDQMSETTRLTRREQEVVHLLLEGKTNKEVAVCIRIGEYTVKDHIKRIMKKLDVTTRAGIVAKVLRHHFPS